MPGKLRIPSISRLIVTTAIVAAAAFAVRAPASAQDTIKLGLVAAMSGQSAKSGEAIVRGLSLAIDEINAKGGLLGKKVTLLVRDDESNPAKGLIAARELIQREKVAALIGGLDTPVALAIVPFVNNAKMPFVVPWAAGTTITQNGASSNYVFRVSAMDDEVDKAIVQFARKKSDDQEARPDSRQQSVGRVERAGPQGGDQGDRYRPAGYREIRSQRR